jgi:hypothetical protein
MSSLITKYKNTSSKVKTVSNKNTTKKKKKKPTFFLLFKAINKYTPSLVDFDFLLSARYVQNDCGP